MLRNVLAVLAFAVYTAFFAALAIISWPFFPTGYGVQKLAMAWSWLTMRMCGARLEVEGLENVDRGGIYIFTSNHLSTFDILALLFLQPTWRFRMVAKKSLFYIPIFGWAIWLAGFIAIDRRNRKSAIRTTQRALKRIQRGTSVVIYPEGTRSRTGKLLPFKTGAFLMAIRARVPVVPVTVVGSHRLQPPDTWLFRPGRFKIFFDRPIPTADLQEKDRGALAGKVRSIIARRLHQEGQIDDDELAEILENPNPHVSSVPVKAAS